MLRRDVNVAFRSEINFKSWRELWTWVTVQGRVFGWICNFVVECGAPQWLNRTTHTMRRTTFANAFLRRGSSSSSRPLDEVWCNRIITWPGGSSVDDVGPDDAQCCSDFYQQCVVCFVYREAWFITAYQVGLFKCFQPKSLPFLTWNICCERVVYLQ